MDNVVTFDGRTSHKKRHEVLSEKCDALVLQIQTGCEGLNLQENYSEIFFVSPHWNPAVEDQAIARCHRIGQTKPVFIERFEMSKFAKEDSQVLDTMSIDNYTTSVQETKRLLANECINPT
jgi:SNF2 family DNA or RNA helicase